MLFRDTNQLIIDIGEFIPKLEEFDNNDNIKTVLNNCIDSLTKYKVKLGNNMATSLKNKI